MMSLPSAFALAFFVAVAPAAQAQEFGSKWIADAHSGCRMWDPTPLPDEIIRWSGRCVGGYGEERGTLEWYSRGVLFETDVADFVRGKLNGHGNLRFTEGGEFDGQFRDQKPNGPGTYHTVDGRTYSGDWKDGCFRDGKRRANFNVAPQDCNLSS
jgi:hypothetical protein